jgi:hypothetical protein
MAASHHLQVAIAVAAVPNAALRACLRVALTSAMLILQSDADAKHSEHLQCCEEVGRCLQDYLVHFEDVAVTGAAKKACTVAMARSSTTSTACIIMALPSKKANGRNWTLFLLFKRHPASCCWMAL